MQSLRAMKVALAMGTAILVGENASKLPAEAPREHLGAFQMQDLPLSHRYYGQRQHHVRDPGQCTLRPAFAGGLDLEIQSKRQMAIRDEIALWLQSPSPIQLTTLLITIIMSHVMPSFQWDFRPR